MSKVKDPKLAGEGKKRIAWAEDHMPVLMAIRKQFAKDKPLKGLTIAACLHVTKETAVLMRTLKDGGAVVGLCGSNPLSTQDDIAAALAEDGIATFAWRGVNNDEYYWCLEQVLNLNPNITMDDGGDLVATIHSKRTDLLKTIIGGTEETTTGVIRFRSMEKDKALKYPVISVNDADTKHLFDNFYGTGQSTIDGILRSTSILLAGKNFVVGGYGMCGKGIATRARGMGCNVIVTEVDPVKALQAYMDGFRVMSMSEAAKIGDIFVTASGDKDLICKEHIQNMKSGAILANSGHFNVEINIKDLESISKGKTNVRPNVDEYMLKNGSKIYLLGEGRLVNLAAAEGHPSEVMQMSFANQALCAKYLKENKGRLEPKVYNVPKEIDNRVAQLALAAAGIKIDTLSNEQKKYLESWQEGT